MKKFNNKNMVTVGVLGLVVVMTVALALTLNGSTFQGYLNRSAAPVNQNLYKVNPGVIKVPLKPLSVEPQSPEPVPANMEITRAELAKLIVEATGVPTNTAGGPHYPDVTSDQWYYDYIETAHNMGWMVGYPNGMFNPAGKVNRAEGAKIFTLSVIANCNNGPAYSEPYYKDVSPADWYSGAVHKMADCKMVDILPSDKSMYFPSYLLSRGRAQYMIDNAKKAGWIK